MPDNGYDETAEASAHPRVGPWLERALGGQASAIDLLRDIALTATARVVELEAIIEADRAAHTPLNDAVFMPVRLLDTEEAAWYLNQTPRWVRDKWSRRELAAVKVGRSVRFRVDDLDAYVEAHRVEVVR